MNELLNTLYWEARHFLSPLKNALQSKNRLYRFLLNFGWQIDPILYIDIEQLAEKFNTLEDFLTGLRITLDNLQSGEGEVDMDQLQTLFDDLKENINDFIYKEDANGQEGIFALFAAVLNHPNFLGTGGTANFGVPVGTTSGNHVKLPFSVVARQFGEDLVNHLITLYLRDRIPPLFYVFVLLGYIRKERPMPIYFKTGNREYHLRYAVERALFNARHIDLGVFFNLFAQLDFSKIDSFDAFLNQLYAFFQKTLKNLLRTHEGGGNIRIQLFRNKIEVESLLSEYLRLLVDADTDHLTLLSPSPDSDVSLEIDADGNLAFTWDDSPFIEMEVLNLWGASLIFTNFSSADAADPFPILSYTYDLNTPSNLGELTANTGLQLSYTDDASHTTALSLIAAVHFDLSGTLTFTVNKHGAESQQLNLGFLGLSKISMQHHSATFEITANSAATVANLSLNEDFYIEGIPEYLNITGDLSLENTETHTLMDMQGTLKVMNENGEEVPALSIPFLGGFGIGIPQNITAGLRIDKNTPDQSFFSLGVNPIEIVLPHALIKKADHSVDVWTIQENSPVKISVAGSGVMLKIVANGKFFIAHDATVNNTQINIDPLFIGAGENGIFIEAQGVSLFADDQTGQFDLTQGVSIEQGAIYFSNDLPFLPDGIDVENFQINAQGVSGKITAIFDVDESEEKKYLFGVIPAYLTSVALEIENNIPISADIRGAIQIPSFEDWINVRIAFDAEWNILVNLSSDDPEGVTLRKEELIALTLQSLQINIEDQFSQVSFTVSGGLEPLLWNSDGLQWPRVDVEDLSIIKSLSNLDEPPIIKFKEAWVDLKDLATLDLFGFHFELNKIGVGYIETTDKLWIDLTGSLRLMEQLPLGLGVEGFRLTWPRLLYEELQIENLQALTIEEVLRIATQIEVKFDGVYIFYGIPQTVEFEGYIRFIKEAQKVGFAGDMALRVPASGLALEAGLMVGMNFQNPPYPFLYVYFGILLPSGIPLGQSGLALKGAKGLFGINVTPDRTPDQNPYYDWYKRGPIEGAHPTNKWRDQIWSVAFGAGITITTTDGKILGVQGLLVLVIPGPIIMIEGKALVFDGVFPGDGPLKALAYFDGNELTAQFNIEAALELVEGVIDVNAGIEAFFDFQRFYNWHLYLGKDEPTERRIYANFLKIPVLGWLFEGNCYLMLDMADADTFRSRLGVYIGFEPPSFDLVVAAAKLKAVLEGTGLLTINPFQFNGDIGLEAVLEVQAFGFNIVGIEASANVAVEGALPLVVDAHIHCHADLPVPDLEAVPVVGGWISNAIAWFEENVTELPDIPEYIEFEVPFYWEFDAPPAIDPLVKDMAVESYFVQGGGSIMNTTDAGETGKLIHALSVPLDAKPTIIFDQHMNQLESFDFAGYLSEEPLFFMSGKIAFKPVIADIVLYQLPKDQFNTQAGTQAWKETGRASASDPDQKLWGMYRPEFKTDDAQNAARRILRLWNSNAFDFVNGIHFHVPSNDPDMDADAASYFEQYRASQHGLYAEKPAEVLCIDQKVLKVALDRKMEPVLVRQGAMYVQQLTLRNVILKSLALGMYADAAQASGTYYIESHSPDRSIPSLHIHFPETVVWVEITALTWWEEMKPDFYTFRNAPVQIDKENRTGKERRRILQQEESRCTARVSPIIKVDEKTVVIEVAAGFHCIDIHTLSLLHITRICWLTRPEVEREHQRKLQSIRNQDILDKVGLPTVLLSTGSYYKLEVRHTLAIDPDHSDPVTLALYKSFPQVGQSIMQYLDENEVEVTETQYFQTDGPPQALNPYIKWVSPKHQSGAFFCEDDFVIRFRRDYIHQLYPDLDNSVAPTEFPYKLEAFLKDAEGNIIRGYFHNWTKSESTTLLPEEQEWYAYAQAQLQTYPAFPKDDILELRRHMLLKSSADLGINDWTTIPLSTKNNERPKWKVEPSGQVAINNKVYAGTTPSLLHGGSLFVAGEADWENYDFQFEMLADTSSSGALGGVFLYASEKNYYLLRMNKGTRKSISLIKVQKGEQRILTTKAIKTHDVRMIPVGRIGLIGMKARFSIYAQKVAQTQLAIVIKMDGREVLQLTDTNPAAFAGKAGFYSCNASGSFSNIKVSSQVQQLRPKSRYELILTGGEGGKTLFKDHFTHTQLSHKWLHTNQVWHISGQSLRASVLGSPITYHQSLEDFETTASLQLNTGDTLAFLLRFPDEQREPSNRSYYELQLSRNDNTYQVILFNKNEGHSAAHTIAQKDLNFESPALLPLRIRMVGNTIKVWLFEQQALNVELSDYRQEFHRTLQPLNPRTSHASFENFTRHSMAHPVSDRISLPEGIIRVYNYQTAYVGKFSIVMRSGNAEVQAIELREAVLFSSSFMTSAFHSFSELIDSYNNDLAALTISSSYSPTQFEQEILQLIASQQQMVNQRAEHFKNETLFGTEALDREALELSKQAKTAATTAHDQLFLNFMDKMSDIAYQPLPGRLRMYKIVNQNNDVLGLLLRSPEPLDPRLITQTNGFGFMGRSSFALAAEDSPSEQIPVYYITNGDGTMVFVYHLHQNTEPNANTPIPHYKPAFLSPGIYQLLIQYLRDHEDDKKENETFDHLFDRPYVLSHSDKTATTLTIDHLML